MDFIIGSEDWRHDGWDEIYYPADLPSEWRFDYYANEFRAVYLDEAAWSSLDESQWRALAEDAPEDFEFVLGWRAAPAAALLELKAILGEPLALVLWQGAGAPPALALPLLEASQPGVFGNDGHLVRLLPADEEITATEMKAVFEAILAATPRLCHLFLCGRAPRQANLEMANTFRQLLIAPA